MTKNGLMERPPSGCRQGGVLNFERFLESCEDIAFRGDIKGREEFKSWKTSSIFHSYVESLEDRLDELATSYHKGRGIVPSAQLEDFQRRVQKLVDSLGAIPDPGMQRQEMISILQKSMMGLSTGGAPPPMAVRPQLNSTSTDTVSRGVLQQQQQKFQPISISDASKVRLQQQSELQDSLAEELADMASALKNSTKAVEAKVQERNVLLDQTDHALATSVQGTKSSVSGVQKARKSSRMNFCFTLMVLLALGLGFAGMYVFIRVTSFTGYKKERVTTTYSTSNEL